MQKPFSILFSALWLSGLALSAVAEAPLSPKAQYAADSKKAQARYGEDKKLCNDELSSNARLQCRRDAKAEYDQAMAAAKAQMIASTASTRSTTTASPVKAQEVQEARPTCPECGKVFAISMTEKAGEGGAAGILAGGAAGAVLGNQVGGGIGKDLATIAGAVGGAYAGKKIEERLRTHKVWSVGVIYNDGTKSNFEFDNDPGLKVGDAVKNSGNTIIRN